jgi:hypothetical protein
VRARTPSQCGEMEGGRVRGWRDNGRLTRNEQAKSTVGSHGQPWAAMGSHGQPWAAMGSHSRRASLLHWALHRSL